MDKDRILAETRAWVDRAVIGLNLCPFAKAVQVEQQVRYVVRDACTAAALREALIDEMRWLCKADPLHIDTTLLMRPE